MDWCHSPGTCRSFQPQCAAAIINKILAQRNWDFDQLHRPSSKGIITLQRNLEFKQKIQRFVVAFAELVKQPPSFRTRSIAGTDSGGHDATGHGFLRIYRYPGLNRHFTAGQF